MWALKRRLFFTVVILVLFVGLGLFVANYFFFPTPTCIDSKRNGTETGIDCGGACERKCVEDTVPLRVTWAKTFIVGEDLYDVAAMIANDNVESSPAAISVTISVIGKDEKVLYTKKISQVAPRLKEFPVIIQELRFEEPPVRVDVSLEESYSYALPAPKMYVRLQSEFNRISKKAVEINVTNVGDARLDRIPVLVVLFDEDLNPIAVGKTQLDALVKDGSKKLTTSWRKEFSRDPFQIKVYPIINPYGDKKKE